MEKWKCQSVGKWDWKFSANYWLGQVLVKQVASC